MVDRDDELPRTLEVLWRRAGRVPRERRQRLTLERIVAAAIELAQTEGLAALSMSRLAERLDCATMSLYRHVASKDELHALMIDVASGAPPHIASTDDWEIGLAQWARALRALYYQHPWILQIPVNGPPLEPGQLAWLECGLQVLQLAKLEPVARLSTIMLLLHYVRGEAQLSADLLNGDEQDPAAYGRTLARLIDRDGFPALSALIAAGIFESDETVTDASADFEFGLARIIDGVRCAQSAP